MGATALSVLLLWGLQARPGSEGWVLLRFCSCWFYLLRSISSLKKLERRATPGTTPRFQAGFTACVSTAAAAASSQPAAFQGCRSVEEFQCLNRIEEGTYGVVYRAKDKKTGVYSVGVSPEGGRGDVAQRTYPQAGRSFF